MISFSVAKNNTLIYTEKKFFHINDNNVQIYSEYL